MDLSDSLDPDSYHHLKQLARRIYSERGFGHASVQPTMLLHEAWLKIASSTTRYESKAHFLAIAARAMRQILTDRARANSAAKRGGGNLQRTTLAGIASIGESPLDLLAINQAITRLSQLNADAARVTELRLFGDLTMAEIAEVSGVSLSSVERQWRFARAFLKVQLEG